MNSDGIDFQRLTKQFNNTEELDFINLQASYNRSPDEIFYKIETRIGILWVFEVDYIGNFNTDVLDVIKEEVGQPFELFEVKVNLIFEDSTPYRKANVYKKSSDWDIISKYANEKYGSKDYYYNFLIKPLVNGR